MENITSEMIKNFALMMDEIELDPITGEPLPPKTDSTQEKIPELPAKEEEEFLEEKTTIQ